MAANFDTFSRRHGRKGRALQTASGQPDTLPRPREFKVAECIDTATIAALSIDEITLLDTRYFGKLYVGNSKGIEVVGPANALRARMINVKHHLGQKPFERTWISPAYFSKVELIEHAIVMVSHWSMVQFMVLGNSFDDPNDCEVVWRRHPRPITNDEIPF